MGTGTADVKADGSDKASALKKATDLALADARSQAAAAELGVPDRAEIAAVLRELSRRGGGYTARVLAGARAEVAAEGRALERLRPSAQLAQARERAGYLLDRATRALRGEIGRRADAEQRLGSRLGPVLATQLAARGAALERSAAALAALGPQATLEVAHAHRPCGAVRM